MRRMFWIAVGVCLFGVTRAGAQPPPPPPPPDAAAPAPTEPAPAAPSALPIPNKTLPEAVPPAPGPAAPSTTSANVLDLDFAYGTEKKVWIDAVTARFNAAKHTLPSGEVIRVKTQGAGSGEIIDEVLSGTRKPHLVSPAAGAFIELGNAASREKNQGDLVGETVELVRSPIVVMMWRDQAEKIGWPDKAISWRDLFDYARNPAKWQEAAGANGGPFRLGHTQPDQSNSGLHAIIAEALAAAGKFEGVSRTDVNKPEVKTYLAEVEKAVPYYINSTGTLARKMIKDGPSALTAAIVYENLVIEANQAAKRRNPSAKPEVVAIYPSEGTFPSEHPVGIVQRPWVTDKHRQAAGEYIAFLRAKPQQEESKKSGFRPSDESISLDDLLKPELGVNASQPAKLLKPPPASAISVIRTAWRDAKNPSAAPVQEGE